MCRKDRTKVGMARSSGTERPISGADMVREAVESGKIDRPDLVFAFCSTGVPADQFFKEVKESLPPAVPVIGGSAIGIITNDFLSYKDPTAGLMIIQSDLMRFKTEAVGGIDKNERDAGERLARRLPAGPEERLFLVFYDSIRKPPTEESAPLMNASSGLLSGIEAVLGQGVPVLGAGLIGDYSFSRTTQFCGSYVDSQHAVGLMLGGDFSLYYQIMHGCMPLDGVYHTITDIEGALLRRLDDRPTVEIIDETFGSDEWQNEHPLAFLTIGVNRGEKYGTYREEDYVSRLIVGAAPDRSGVILFEPDLAAGMTIQFMTRDAERMVESARKNAGRLLERIARDHKKPFFGFYIDCAGRAGEYSNTLVEEASEIQSALNRYNVPLFGFYSGVEIAPLRGKSKGLDWTGVLIILAEDS